MKYTIEAACGCHMGKRRKNNEDNFLFEGKCLEVNNEGLRNVASFTDDLRNGLSMAVFDGMGGENFGEIASYTAARKMQEISRKLSDYFMSERKFLMQLAMKLNDAVVEAQKRLCTERCGTTMVALYFNSGYVYACNVGDSRAYRLRDGEFLQLSVDHVEKKPPQGGRKPYLTQHIGIDPEEMVIEPYIAKGKINRGDRYLLCSDGLTDMLSNFEISDILTKYDEPNECIHNLIQAALEKGGRDNITAIVCKLI